MTVILRWFGDDPIFDSFDRLLLHALNAPETAALWHKPMAVLAIQREMQNSKTFAKTANSDQGLNMTRHALDKS